jgi:hypothetical protein
MLPPDPPTTPEKPLPRPPNRRERRKAVAKARRRTKPGKVRR